MTGSTGSFPRHFMLSVLPSLLAHNTLAHKQHTRTLINSHANLTHTPHPLHTHTHARRHKNSLPSHTQSLTNTQDTHTFSQTPTHEHTLCSSHLHTSACTESRLHRPSPWKHTRTQRKTQACTLILSVFVGISLRLNARKREPLLSVQGVLCREFIKIVPNLLLHDPLSHWQHSGARP